LEKKPDVVVQVVVLAEDNAIRDLLLQHDIVVQTISEVSPIEVQPSTVLSHLYTYLGKVLYYILFTVLLLIECLIK